MADGNIALLPMQDLVTGIITCYIENVWSLLEKSVPSRTSLIIE